MKSLTASFFVLEKVVRAAKVRPSVFTAETSAKDFDSDKTHSAKQTTDSKCEEQVITVDLTREFQEVLDELLGRIKPLLSRLQGNGVIPQTKTLSNLNPDYTRFVLKQAQMSVKEGDADSKESQIYRLTVCLHALVSSVDLLMQSGLEAALGKEELHIAREALLCSYRQSNLHELKIANCPRVEKLL